MLAEAKEKILFQSMFCIAPDLPAKIYGKMIQWFCTSENAKIQKIENSFTKHYFCESEPWLIIFNFKLHHD